MLSIPAGSTSGKVMRLKGKGFGQKAGGRGDQLVRLMVDLPKDDAALARLVNDWTDTRPVRADLGVLCVADRAEKKAAAALEREVAEEVGKEFRAGGHSPHSPEARAERAKRLQLKAAAQGVIERGREDRKS